MPPILIDAAAVVATGEPQVVIRGGVLHIARVLPSRAADALLTPPPDGVPWRLAVASRASGTFDDLVLEAIPDADAPLAAGRIRVVDPGHRRQLPRRDDHPRAVPRRRRDGHRGHRRRHRSRLRRDGVSRSATG